MIEEKSVFILFLDEDWDVPPLGFTRKRLILALAEHLDRTGAQVLCVNRPVSLCATFVKYPGKLFRWIRGKGRSQRVSKNMYLFTPWMILHEKLALFIPGLAGLNRLILKKQILKYLRTLGLGDKKRIAWIFHPYQKDMLGVAEEDLSIYECYDDHSGRSCRSKNKRMLHLENTILDTVDIVFTTSAELCRTRKTRNGNTFFVPNGVEYDLYDRHSSGSPDLPEELKAIPGPIIGYVGGIDQRIDFELISGIAGRYPAWSFVFIGMVCRTRMETRRELKRMQSLKNVHFLGTKIHREVPGYVANFDVAIIPYARKDYLRSVYPSKINEYLAMGKHVVTTDFSDLSDFEGLVTVAGTEHEFVRGIEKGLAEADPVLTARRKATARNNSWSNRAGLICDVISDGLTEGSNKRKYAGNNTLCIM